MPTYEYRCVAGHQYETRESFSAKPRQKCTVCGKQADRMLFAPPIVFKGSGFYATDSRKADSAAPASNGAAPDAGGHSHDGPGHSHPHEAGTAAPDTSGPLESAASA